MAKKHRLIDFIVTPKQIESTENGTSELESKSVPKSKSLPDLHKGMLKRHVR